MKKITYFATCLAILVSTLVPLKSSAAATTNLLANPSAEASTNNKPLNWTTNSWGVNTPTFTYEQTGNTGTKSLTVNISGYSSGDAKWMHDQVPITPGKSYTYTNYSKSSVATELDLAYKDASGAMKFVYLTTVPASSTWKQVSATFTVPSGAVSVSVYHILYSNGALTVDDASLTQDGQTTPPPDPTPDPTPTPEPTPTPDPAPSSDNLIQNSSFEVVNGSDPSKWHRGGWGVNSASYLHQTGGARTGNKAVKITMSSYSSGDAKWYSDPISVNVGTTYSYNDYYISGVNTRVVAAMVTSSGAISYVELPAAPASSIWALYSTNLTVPADVKTVTIYHLLDQVGSLLIDDTSFIAQTSEPNPVPTPDVSSLVGNPSFEIVSTTDGSKPAGWQTNQWGSLNASFVYVNGDAHTGVRSSKVTVTNYSSGDAKWSFTPLTTLVPGSQYSLSAWYKTNAQPRVVASYLDTGGVTRYLELARPLTNSSSATTWQQYTSTLDMPLNAVNMTVYFLISSNGWLMTDDFSITNHKSTGFVSPIISITFDDGLSSIYTNGLPLLQKYGLPSTQYLLSGSLNTPGYMTTAMAQSFKNSGSEIGSHTVTHPNLTSLSNAQLMSELTNSQTFLRQMFGADVANAFASPYGSYNSTTLAMIRQYYQSHRSTDVGFNTKDNFNSYNILVQNINTDTTSAEVAGWVAKAKSEKSWLVLVYHAVSDSTNEQDYYSVSVENLDQQLANIKASGVQVKTVSQALNIIQSQY